jgi:hypothetical protein
MAALREDMRESQILDSLLEALASTAPGATIDGLSLHSDGDSACVEYAFRIAHYVQQSGNLFFLRPGLTPAPGLPALPEEQRKLPIWFGKPRHVEYNAAWSFDDRWTCDSMDHKIESDCGAASISGHILSDANALNLSWTFEFNGELLKPDDYSKVRSFRNQAEGFREAKIMLRDSR